MQIEFLLLLDTFEILPKDSFDAPKARKANECLHQAVSRATAAKRGALYGLAILDK